MNSDRVPENEIEEPSKPQATFAGLATGEILEAVGHIRQSRTMKGCPKLMRMLDFVVEATVGGEAAYLKETTLGVFVFGRKPDYDPKVDTIVRSQAWRLRAKLKKYYATEGLHDSIIVSLPRGHYVPLFQSRTTIVERTHHHAESGDSTPQ